MVRGGLASKPQTHGAHEGYLACVYLDVVIFTLVRGFQAEVAEVEFDPVALWDADVPHDVLVVRVWLGEVGGGEAAIQPCHFDTQRDAEQGGQDKSMAPTGIKIRFDGCSFDYYFAQINAQWYSPGHAGSTVLRYFFSGLARPW